jgi:signal transduction histidine kinase
MISAPISRRLPSRRTGQSGPRRAGTWWANASAKISATARQAVKSLDEIVWAVNPRNDTLGHLLDYAGQFALDYLRTVGIRCRLDFPETEVPPYELSTDLRHNLFLVIKEALHNIFKHAGATEVWLRVSWMNRR